MNRAILLYAGLALLMAATTGCSFGSSTNPSFGKADPNTSIDVTGAIGGIHIRDTQIAVEKRLGPGKTISTSKRKQKVGGDYTLTRVLYPASQLVVLYVTSASRPASVFGVFTTSPRYHTADGLQVGSTLAQARREPGIRCYDQVSYFACQGGLGYEKPISSFTVKDGRVVRVFTAAFADKEQPQWSGDGA
jgi:hypothetical protein